MQPHVHRGYFHNEYTAKGQPTNLTTRERTLLDRIIEPRAPRAAHGQVTALDQDAVDEAISGHGPLKLLEVLHYSPNYSHRTPRFIGILGMMMPQGERYLEEGGRNDHHH